ncbi:MAG: glycosyltransferase [Rariglobus sp.]|jgi:glycosyltransferase involved in cell wall biosynthesis|nr:glycosyltransferase [Rariglobus sp.]
MFSIVILTLNEEQNLPACLASTAGCNDVVVLDSGSTDRTAEIALAAGARVVVNRFENFAQQRNHAHDAIAFRHDWVFHLDADETLTPALVAECAARAASPETDKLDGFFAAPRMMFRGRWIPHCTDYPAWQARFVHTRRFRFVQAGHGQREAPGLRMERLKQAYFHNLSSQGEDEIRAKHARYARAEATAFMTARRPARLLWQALFGRDPLARRRAMKEASYHLPARGALRFAYQYFLRRGFLDGAPGFAYCRLLADYEQAISREIRHLQASVDKAPAP